MQPLACPVVLKQHIWDLFLISSRQPDGREVVPRTRHLKKKVHPKCFRCDHEVRAKDVSRTRRPVKCDCCSAIFHLLQGASTSTKTSVSKCKREWHQSMEPILLPVQHGI